MPHQATIVGEHRCRTGTEFIARAEGNAGKRDFVGLSSLAVSRFNRGVLQLQVGNVAGDRNDRGA
jgi:hypothetical protein